jgi:hypothetical protein
MLNINKSRRIMPVPRLKNWMLILLLFSVLASLLLAGCEGASLDINLDGGGGGEGIQNSNLFWILIVALIVIVAIVGIGRR